MSQWNERILLARGIAGLLFNRTLIGTGLKPTADGWRRGAGFVLCEEPATFFLSALGLTGGADLEKKLAAFLQAETALHLVVDQSGRPHIPMRVDHPAYSFGVEPWLDDERRFLRPENWQATSGETQAPVFNFICRVSPENVVDVWVRVNHVALDGAPAQEMMSRLESAWGKSQIVVAPAPEAFAKHHTVQRCGPREGIGEIQTFVDFSPMLNWRKRVNQNIPEPLTFASAFMWCLAQHSTYSGLRMGTTVELPATQSIGRGVGVAVVRPTDYFNKRDGIARYAKDFNRQLEQNRKRESSGCKTLAAAAYLPPKVANAVLRFALKGDAAFGSMGVTVLKDAFVFGAPLGDVGHPNGFIAIGSTSLPCKDGRKVGCVHIKGPVTKIAGYPQAIQSAVAACDT